MPANVITSHSKFQLNHAKFFRDMNLRKLASFFFLFFFVCFSSFRQATKVANVLSNCPEIWYTARRYKCASLYWIWLQYHKRSQCYKQLFTKDNTNMLSSLQGKLLMARNWNSARRQGNYWTSNLLLFERNYAKDHEDIAKNPTVGNNYAIKIY